MGQVTWMLIKCLNYYENCILKYVPVAPKLSLLPITMFLKDLPLRDATYLYSFKFSFLDPKLNSTKTENLRAEIIS